MTRSAENEIAKLPMNVVALYLCYFNVRESLVQTQVISYLRELAKRGVDVHLLTFEKERLSPETRDAVRRELAAAGITWHARRYHARPSLLATLYDVFAGVVAAAKIHREFGVTLVHARSQVPAAMASVLKTVYGLPFVFDLRGLMAEEYADAGHWKFGDFKFRLVKRMERVFFRRADAVVVLTHNIKETLVRSGEFPAGRPADDVTVIPCCVDVERYDVRDEDARAYRRARGWDDRKVFVYVGKLSDLYYPNEMARLFAALYLIDDRFFFQILTPSDARPLLDALARAGVPADSVDVGFATQEELPVVLAACDASVSFRKGELSKRAASPTKVGECLMSGLPVVTNDGIGDCDEILGGRDLGVVMREFTDESFERAARELTDLLADASVRERCRAFAASELSLPEVGGPRYASVYARALENARGAHSDAGRSRATAEGGGDSH